MCLSSCYSKPIEKIEEVDDDTMVIWESKLRTDSIMRELPKIDEVIHQEEDRIIKNFNQLKNQVAKVVIIHDTIVIKEKTNFWGRKRVSMDSMQAIDTIEYK